MPITESQPLVTRAGVRLHVRRARGADEQLLATFFSHVTPEDLRFRFLTGVRQVSRERLAAMADANDDRTESLVAFDDGGEIVATAMLAGDATRERAEAAIAVRGDRKGQGIGWRLLETLVSHARQMGYAAIEAIEDRANNEALVLEREMGFETSFVEGDPSLVRVVCRLR
ncbi:MULTISPECIES: GNAT family N-acetyltransferase [unclassified Sphingomonas]|uniref:GNAT family N-acetyltransferase n=1 Tax=unclassified Sphingomonas TaxID=196159 RepID=UPI00226A27D7|nr:MULTISPECIES: GNAT family N-acetyltransferase [unclassified Sphingomonas]